MRKRILLVLLALTSLVLSACGGAKKGELTVYTSHPPDVHESLIEAFEKDSGIKVTVVYAGTGDLFKRIEAEAANPLGDVMFGGGAETHEANRQLLEPYTPKEVDQLAPGMVAPDNSWTGFTALPIVVMYNKDLVAENEVPKSWADLADPKWHDKIAMPDAAKSGSAFTTVATILHAAGRDNGEGWKLMEAIVANSKILGSSTQPPKGTNDGEYHMALTHEEAAAKYVVAGGPVGVVYPSEGTSSVPDATAIIKGAKNKENAQKFVDFMISKGLQEQVVKELNRRSVRLDIAPAEGLPDTGSITWLEYDMGWAASNRDAVLDHWKEIVVSQ